MFNHCAEEEVRNIPQGSAYENSNPIDDEYTYFNCPGPLRDCRISPLDFQPIKFDLANEKDKEEGGHCVFKGAENITTDSLNRVNDIIASISPDTVLEEFMISIAEYTADNGELMLDIISNEVNNFKEYIKSIYAYRNDDVFDLLKTDQRRLKNKYDRIRKEFDRNQKFGLESLTELLPGFNLASYLKDPNNYVQNLQQSNDKITQKAKGGAQMFPDRRIKAALHKKTWLMQETKRLECKNEERMCELNNMMSQHAQICTNIAMINKKAAAYNQRMEEHAACLKNKIGYNDNVIAFLTEEINDVDDKGSQSCPLISPSEILGGPAVVKCCQHY